MHAVILSDTHIKADRRRRLPDAVYAALRKADVVLHAGDLVAGEVLEELRRFAPVHAVLGNNDRGLERLLPDSLTVDLDGVRFALVHDSGPAAGRAGRLARRFPDAAVVVFGHSHIPWNQAGIGGQRLFNPGSPTERRTQPARTFGTIDVAGGRVLGAEIHAL